MFYAILSLCLIGSAVAQVPSLGRCPEIQTAPQFNLSSYMGRWYEAHRYFSEIEATGKCITANYALNDDDTIRMENFQISVLTGKSYSLKATARIPDIANPAKLKVKLDNNPIGLESDYFVLGTDYENYAVVYSCYNVKIFNVKHAWILTRERDAPKSVIDAAIAVAEQNHLHKFLFLKTNQSNC